MCVNNLPRVVTWRWNGWESSPRPRDHESETITIIHYQATQAWRNFHRARRKLCRTVSSCFQHDRQVQLAPNRGRRMADSVLSYLELASARVSWPMWLSLLKQLTNGQQLRGWT